MTGLDVTPLGHERLRVDLTCAARDTEHAEAIVQALGTIDGVMLGKVSDRTFLLHLGGKIETRSRCRCATATTCPWPTRPGWPGSPWPSPATPRTCAG